MDYFKRFPVIDYKGDLARNIMARVKLSNSTLNDPTQFQPYVVDGPDRADMLAADYYDDPKYAWLVWLSNQTIDPYYQLPLSESALSDLISSKYGSTEKAIDTILFYRTNWATVPSEISVETFNNIGANKKYYQPVLDVYLQPAKYVRKRETLTISTNGIAQISSSNIGDLLEGEPLVYGSKIIGNVVAWNTSNCTFQHLNLSDQDIAQSPGRPVTGKWSGTTFTIDIIEIIHRTIQPAEFQFWEQVNAYEYEVELNQKRSEIKFLDNRLKVTAASGLSTKLKNFDV